jgi:hypothetical protein
MLNKRFFKKGSECEVTFRIAPQDAGEVVLLTEVNGWQPIPMQQLKSGEFKTRVKLPTGRHVQFRYLIDGSRWENDDAADGYVPNEHGSENSVVDTTG